MYSASNGLMSVKGSYYFAGWSAGYQTQLQTNTYTSALTNTDAYVYKYQFGHSTSMNCIFENVMDRSMQTTTKIQLIA